MGQWDPGVTPPAEVYEFILGQKALGSPGLGIYEYRNPEMQESSGHSVSWSLGAYLTDTNHRDPSVQADRGLGIPSRDHTVWSLGAYQGIKKSTRRRLQGYSGPGLEAEGRRPPNGKQHNSTRSKLFTEAKT